MENFSFKVKIKIPNALGRTGVISTKHGNIQTPAFVPVGTKATVKSITPEMLQDLGAQIMLANTYHLYLQPGDELLKKAGGLGKYMHWEFPTMTDSGGFQVFSLGAAFGKEISKITKTIDPSLQIPERSSADEGVPRLATIGNDGVSFRSHINGDLHYITPEKSIEIQHNIGADIIFAFDECTSPTENLRYQEEALERTHAWARRSLDKHLQLNTLRQAQGEQGVALFGIVQGGRDENLRKRSAKFLADIRTEGPERSEGFDGFGIGGSFAKEDMETAVKWVNEILPEDKPRHLLGIGEPEDLFMGVENGVDLFDCVAPTRNARNGTLYTSSGKINILNAQYVEDFLPIENNCGCYTCKNYTRSYVSHLFRAKEMLGGTLSTIHNLYFIVHLVDDMRGAIEAGKFKEFKEEFFIRYNKNTND